MGRRGADHGPDPTVRKGAHPDSAGGENQSSAEDFHQVDQFPLETHWHGGQYLNDEILERV